MALQQKVENQNSWNNFANLLTKLSINKLKPIFFMIWIFAIDLYAAIKNRLVWGCIFGLVLFIVYAFSSGQNI
jgi:hypothetical protein